MQHFAKINSPNFISWISKNCLFMKFITHKINLLYRRYKFNNAQSICKVGQRNKFPPQLFADPVLTPTPELGTTCTQNPWIVHTHALMKYAIMKCPCRKNPPWMMIPFICYLVVSMGFWNKKAPLYTLMNNTMYLEMYIPKNWLRRIRASSPIRAHPCKLMRMVIWGRGISQLMGHWTVAGWVGIFLLSLVVLLHLQHVLLLLLLVSRTSIVLGRQTVDIIACSSSRGEVWGPMEWVEVCDSVRVSCLVSFVTIWTMYWVCICECVYMKYFTKLLFNF